MPKDEWKRKAPRILARLLESLDESYRDEIERSRNLSEQNYWLATKFKTAIYKHMQESLELVKDDPRVRLSEADYKLWEVLED